MANSKIKSFEDLIVWKEAQNLAVSIYKETKDFPSDEKFGLTNQIRRASVSISANIAEGFGRNSAKNKLQFYTIAYGSLLEVKNFIYLAQKLGYLDKNTVNVMLNGSVSVQKLLNAFMRPLKQ